MSSTNRYILNTGSAEPIITNVGGALILVLVHACLNLKNPNYESKCGFCYTQSHVQSSPLKCSKIRASILQTPRLSLPSPLYPLSPLRAASPLSGEPRHATRVPRCCRLQHYPELRTAPLWPKPHCRRRQKTSPNPVLPSETSGFCGVSNGGMGFGKVFGEARFLVTRFPAGCGVSSIAGAAGGGMAAR